MQRTPCRARPRPAAAAPRGIRSIVKRQRSRERAAGRQVGELRHRAGDRRQPRAPCARRARPGARTGPACTDGRDAAKTVVGRPALDDACRRTSPACAARSRAITPRSCEIRIIAMPRSATRSRDQVEDLALDGDVERGGRLVGDQQVGLAGERHRDGDALALAAGELVRIGVDAPGGIGNADAVEQGDRFACAPARADMPLCSRSGSATWWPIVCTGLSAVIGSWKIMPMRLPRSLHILARPSGRASSWPSKPDAAADLGALRQQAHQRHRRDRLAAAGFADEAQRLAALQRKADAAHGLRRAAAGVEPDAADCSTSISGSCARIVSAPAPGADRTGRAVRRPAD